MPQNTTATPESTAAPVVLRRLRIAMGTTLAIEARASTPPPATAGLAAALSAVAEVAERLHSQHPDSDLARLGAARPGTPVPLWRGTLALLQWAKTLARASDGVFDPCLPECVGRIADVELIEGAEPRAIAHAPVAIDCGGIAKGYAVDAAVEALRAAGCSAGLVNAGGDVRVFGETSSELLLRQAAGGFRPLELRQAALAVSDRDGARPTPGHRGYYRRAGLDPGIERYAAVRASRAMVADALTKCVLLCPTQVSARLLEEFGAVRVA